MPTPPDADDDDDILKAVLADEDPPTPDEDAIQAVLADPVSGGIIARATCKHERLLTAKGLDHARRTLAILFLIDPRAASLLTRAREGDASAAVPNGNDEAEPVKRRKTTP